MALEPRSLGILKFPGWEKLDWLVHGFTTRQTGDFRQLPSASRTSELAGVEGMTLMAVKQVHSDRVLVVNGSYRPALDTAPEADALITAEAGSLLGVRTADCMPLLLLDRRQRVVAAVHAGWKGTALQVSRKAAATMRREFGSLPEELEAVIGPGIGRASYEVGPEVAAQFPDDFVVPGEGGNNPCLDLEAANRSQLQEEGVRQVWTAGLCTQSRPDLFFSYRREGAQAGRMMAMIGVKP